MGGLLNKANEETGNTMGGLFAKGNKETGNTKGGPFKSNVDTGNLFGGLLGDSKLKDPNANIGALLRGMIVKRSCRGEEIKRPPMDRNIEEEHQILKAIKDAKTL